ncbi:MAG: PhoP regulatory network YrbL family protein [Cellvibrionaceae bacterium]
MGVIHFESEDQAFARGGNRWCFVDPENNGRCIKVARADRTPEIKRAKKKFPANLKRLSSFDDNREEYSVYARIDQCVGEQAYELIPRCYGFVETSLGKGLVTELVRDSDQCISMSLKQYLWQNGYTDELKAVVEQFKSRWAELGMPSRNLLLHNIVVKQKEGVIDRLVVIDGLGWPDLIPFAYFSKSLARKKASRKAQRLDSAIEKLLQVKAENGDWGYHGWLEQDKREMGLNVESTASIEKLEKLENIVKEDTSND